MSHHPTQSFVLRTGAVYLFLSLLFVLNLVDVPVFDVHSGRMAFFLMGLYYFLVYRPSVLPYPVVFLFGLCLDLVSGGAVGLFAFCFMILSIVVRSQRRFLIGQSWSVVWVGFCTAAMFVTAIQALVFAASGGGFPDLWVMGFHSVASFCLYPLLLPVMTLLNRFVSD